MIIYDSNGGEFSKIDDLLGKTIVKIERINDYSHTMLKITTDKNEVYDFYHIQDCCESVYLNDVIGDFDDLLNTPILLSECITNEDTFNDGEYTTWTFYKLVTINGGVTLRFVGSSNGYYSVDVSISKTIIS